MTSNREEIVAQLVKVGQAGIAEGDEHVIDSYFAGDFVFHGPDGDATLPGLKAFWATMRESFSGFTLERDHVVIDGDYVACQTFMSGVFDKPFSAAPDDLIEPNGTPMRLALLNIFRFTESGLSEEWCQFDWRGFTAQLRSTAVTG